MSPFLPQEPHHGALLPASHPTRLVVQTSLGPPPCTWPGLDAASQPGAVVTGLQAHGALQPSEPWKPAGDAVGTFREELLLSVGAARVGEQGIHTGA